MNQVASDEAILLVFAAASVLIPALVFAVVGYRFGRKGVIRLFVCGTNSLVLITLLLVSFVQVSNIYGFGDEPEWFITLFRHTLLMPLEFLDSFFRLILPPRLENDLGSSPLPSVLLTLLFDLAFYSLPAVFFFV